MSSRRVDRAPGVGEPFDPATLELDGELKIRCPGADGECLVSVLLAGGERAAWVRDILSATTERSSSQENALGCAYAWLDALTEAGPCFDKAAKVDGAPESDKRRARANQSRLRRAGFR